MRLGEKSIEYVLVFLFNRSGLGQLPLLLRSLRQFCLRRALHLLVNLIILVEALYGLVILLGLRNLIPGFLGGHILILVLLQIRHALDFFFAFQLRLLVCFNALI